MFLVEFVYPFATKSNINNPIAVISINIPKTLIVEINFLGVIFFIIIQNKIPKMPPRVFQIMSVISLVPIANINCTTSNKKLVEKTISHLVVIFQFSLNI